MKEINKYVKHMAYLFDFSGVHSNRKNRSKMIKSIRERYSYVYVPYARHYNPRFVYFLPHFYIEVRFILQTTYGLKTEILHFLSLKSAVYIRERFQIESGL